MQFLKKITRNVIKMNASIHSMWIQVQNLIFQQVWKNSEGLLDFFFFLISRNFSNLSSKYEKKPNQVPNTLRLLKIITLMDIFSFYSSQETVCLWQSFDLIIVFPISTEADRRYLIKSCLIASCSTFPPHFVFSK